MAGIAHWPPEELLAWTPRQREVLDLIARGKTNGEIAAALDISLAGAKWHVSEVLSKLGADSREEAAAYWRGRHRPLARLGRAARGFAGLVSLKVAAASAGAAGVAAAVSVTVLVMAGGSSAEEPAAAAATPTATPDVS